MQQYHAENSTRKPLNNYFIEAYYSQNIGLRKPTVASYQYIIDEQKINPNETLFIDDTLKNIEGAKLAGLQTLHLTEDKNLIEIKF
jgi:putative hydrolase of the HAD superfamily